MHVTAIIAAAGKSRRVSGDTPKQFIHIKEKPMLAYTIEKFQDCDAVDDIVVVVAEEYEAFCRQKIVSKWAYRKVMAVVPGGENRQESVYRGLAAAEPSTDICVVHDGARPFIAERQIAAVIQGAAFHGACVLGVNLQDTVKRCDAASVILDTVDRSDLWAVQTPQGFRFAPLLNAHAQAVREGFVGTDDSQLMERLGHRVKMLEGTRDNFKITTDADLAYAEFILHGKKKGIRK